MFRLVSVASTRHHHRTGAETILSRTYCEPGRPLGILRVAFFILRTVGRPGLGASNVATLSRFLRQSVAKGIDGMSHQHADAQNEARSYNSR
jgi:hypothetical protein